jgi:hypothetical protein
MESVINNWRVLLQTAVDETDRTVVEQLVYLTEEVMYGAFQQLSRDPADDRARSYKTTQIVGSIVG